MMLEQSSLEPKTTYEIRFVRIRIFILRNEGVPRVGDGSSRDRDWFSEELFVHFPSA
jgi:hypothetical protein